MAITVTYQYTASIPIEAQSAPVAIDMRLGELISARIDFHVNSHPATALEFEVDTEVVGTANVSIIVVAATELAIARQRLARWIEFIKSERPELSQAPTLQSQLEVSIAPNHATLDFEFKVFNPGAITLTEGTWMKSTGLITFGATAAANLPWPDFLLWQQAVDDMLFTVALL